MKKDFQSIASGASHPVSATLELTYSCNWNCKYCYAVINKKNKLSLAEWKKAIRELEEMSILVLTLTGGEPLLHPDFFSIASYARERGFAIKIFTNGSLLNNDNINKFVALQPLRVDLSIHGADEKTHDSFTGVKGSFKGLMESIELLQNHNIAILLKCAVTRLNENQLFDIKNLAIKLGINVAFDTVVQAANDGDNTTLDYAVSKDFREKYWSEEYDFITEGGGRVTTDWSKVKNVCGAGKKSITIDPYGNILPCSQWRRILGSIRKETLKEIMDNSPELKKVLNITAELVQKLRSMDCGAYCNICPGASENQTGSPLELTKQCRENAIARMQAHKEFFKKNTLNRKIP